MVNTTPSRYPSRSSEEKRIIHQILDEGLHCTIAFMREGQAIQIPTGFCRVDDAIYIHASSKSHFIQSIIGEQVSFSVTLLDGLVLAPTAFDHSFNYRSVVGFSKAEEVTNDAEKLRLFCLFTDRYIPGRSADVGIPTAEQVGITKIVKLDLDNAAAKIRKGDVNVKLSENDAWCGVIPLSTQYGSPEIDQQLCGKVDQPTYINELVNGNNK